jgi:adenine-specific DNA-methyltransferase
MSAKKQKLEFTWVGKENRPKLEPRILLEEAEKSYHAAHRVTDRDLFENLLIQCGKLFFIKDMHHEYTGRVKCIFMDPTYNTGSAFEHDSIRKIQQFQTALLERASA